MTIRATQMCGRMWIFLLVTTNIHWNAAYTTAQQSPFINVPKFDTSVSYRTNICDRQRMLWNDEILFPDALQGLNLTVALPNYQSGKEINFFSLTKDNRIKELTYQGLYTVILDELAARAGFEWRNSFAVYEPRNTTTDGNKTWTDILLWSIEVFDISMEKWGHTVDRMSMGASFPTGFWDSSIILGEIFRSSQSKPVVNLWSFLNPFTVSVWLMIIAAVICTGLVYYLLEHWNKETDERELDAKPLASIFYMAIAFTGHYEMKPNTHPARIVGFSFTFWALIVSSAYTANLASFLVSPRVANYKYSTIQDALRDNAAVCVQKGAIIETILKEKYPSLNIVGKDVEQEVFESLRVPVADGGCDVVAHQFNSFEIYERTKEVNYDCSISSSMKVEEILPAGLATAVDTGLNKCTSLISFVLDYHLTDMANDGFIASAWNDHLSRTGTIECVVKSGSSGVTVDEDDTFSLTVRDVGGIFILHVALSIIALLLGTHQFYVRAKNGDVNDSRTLSSVYGISTLSRRRLQTPEKDRTPRSFRHIRLNDDGDELNMTTIDETTSTFPLELPSAYLNSDPMSPCDDDKPDNSEVSHASTR